MNTSMSSTITEMERLLVADVSTKALSADESETLSRRRERLIRTTSIEKLKKFNNFICSQHYYIIPSLLIWLKTSQTVLTSHMDKCMVYVKSMFLICVIREYVQDKVQILGCERSKLLKSYTPLFNAIVITFNRLTTLLYEELKRFILVSAVYLGIFLIFLQTVCITMLIFSTIPRWGFVFLIGCVLIMSKIAANIMYHNACTKDKNKTELCFKPVEERRRIRKQLKLIGKTISNVKLF